MRFERLEQRLLVSLDALILERNKSLAAERACPSSGKDAMCT
jgi:hypothetical protein